MSYRVDVHPKTLFTSFPSEKEITSYDPAKIYLVPEYILLDNIYSPLVEMTKDGLVQAGVAERFEWDGNDAYFHIRSDLKTYDGIPVTADDAAFSLKRLLVLTGNSHGNLKDILCPDKNLKTIRDPCEGIAVEGNKLILKLKRSSLFLFPMLTAIDFAVIPKKSVDLSTLKIVDYQHTSGPYYVEQQDETGRIFLKANKNHYHYSQNIPQSIELIPANINKPMDSLQKFERGEIDFITTADHVSPDRIIDFAENNPGTSIARTMNIRTLRSRITERGRQHLNQDERFQLGLLIKKSLNEYLLKKTGYEEANQFFPLFGEGSLTDEQLEILNSKFKSIEPKRFGKNIRIRILRMSDTDQLVRILKNNLTDAVIEEGQFSTNRADQSEPDILISGPDTGFLEDIGLISYAATTGDFGFSAVEGEKWLKDYMETPNKEDRLKKLRDLHFDILMEPVVIPFANCSYVALARKGWKLNFSKFFANTQFWLIERER